MLVSIVIPSFNSAPWLAETLKSVLGQTWSELEIIVIDDGSHDGSLDIARHYEAHGVRVVAQPNRGASAARNRGFHLSRGEFIQFLDADDLLSPDKISSQIALLDRHRAGVIASCRWGRFTTDPASSTFVDHAVFRDFTPVDYLLAHTGAAQMMHPAAWLIPRTIADHAGPWDETLSLNDDGEYFARVVLASQGIVFSPTGASLYRSNLPGSLSRQRSRRALESVYRSVTLIADHLHRAEDSPRVRRALADYWQRLVYEIYPEGPDLCRHAEEHVQALGGSSLRPQLGPRQRVLARLLGWKNARRIQHFFP